jgi:hypothetical protein
MLHCITLANNAVLCIKANTKTNLNLTYKESFIMALTLAEIRAKLQAQQNNRGNGASKFSGEQVIYPHWNIPEGTSAKLRFLPDGNTKNSYFWVEKAMINLTFSGIKGEADSKPVRVQVPCVEMYNDGSVCPILAEVRPWFKDPNLEELGRKYWKKKSYLFQGFVHENPIGDDKAPASNPIRRFMISPQIFNLVKTALMDPELENLPTDYMAGLDFIVKKTSKGGYADYSTSSWARKETSLTAEEVEAIETHGLFDLASFLPKKPTDVELQVMKEMFEASVDGQPYDAERWSAYFKPSGFQSKGGEDTTEGAGTSVKPAAPIARPAPAAAATAAAEPDDHEEDDAVASAPVVTPAKTTSKSAEDILAMIRSRKSA